MSIWCSWPHVGTDPTVMYDAGDGLAEVDIGNGDTARGREPIEQHPEQGNVLSYAEGFSNHYPDQTGTHERPAVVAVASIPEWCVPGHDESSHDDPAGPWLRLEVVTPERLNFWAKTPDGEPTVEDGDATVVMDEAAVRALRDQLTEWLSKPKVHPIKESA